ncbi:hypothetical protein [Candidatus Cardinium hertigii]|uniref:hypothetical protein n=1 Tax=Candidatus Cardinium hertigii TaxID=247481 RepID=UPI0013A59A97|nr:hypothetical protein [Candidatus Cardinium hertigii]
MIFFIRNSLLWVLAIFSVCCTHQSTYIGEKPLIKRIFGCNTREQAEARAQDRHKVENNKRGRETLNQKNSRLTNRMTNKVPNFTAYVFPLPADRHNNFYHIEQQPGQIGVSSFQKFREALKAFREEHGAMLPEMQILIEKLQEVREGLCDISEDNEMLYAQIDQVTNICIEYEQNINAKNQIINAQKKDFQELDDLYQKVKDLYFNSDYQLYKLKSALEEKSKSRHEIKEKYEELYQLYQEQVEQIDQYKRDTKKKEGLISKLKQEVHNYEEREEEAYTCLKSCYEKMQREKDRCNSILEEQSETISRVKKKEEIIEKSIKEIRSIMESKR